MVDAERVLGIQQDAMRFAMNLGRRVAVSLKAQSEQHLLPAQVDTVLWPVAVTGAVVLGEPPTPAESEICPRHDAAGRITQLGLRFDIGDTRQTVYKPQDRFPR